MEERLFTFYSEPLQIKSSETGEFYIEGHISTSDIDLVDDIVTPNALKSMDSQLKETDRQIQQILGRFE